MEDLEPGVYIASLNNHFYYYTFVVIVDGFGTQTWMRLKPGKFDKIFYYKDSAVKSRDYTFTRISEALQEVFLK